MDRLPGDLWVLFSKGIQRLAQQDAGSFCFHPLHPLRPGFTCLRKLLTQLPNPACRAECASIHLGNPGLLQRPILLQQAPSSPQRRRGRCARAPAPPWWGPRATLSARIEPPRRPMPTASSASTRSPHASAAARLHLSSTRKLLPGFADLRPLSVSVLR